MHNKIMATALGDIVAAARRLHLVGMLGWQDVRQRYRRSLLGPFWLTISMGVMIATIGLVFGQIFNSPVKVFLPFLAAGMILWGFMSMVIMEGCDAFIAAEGIIKQLPIPLFVHVLRMVWRNLLILAHNIVIFPLVLLAVGRPIGWMALISIPGLLLVTANLLWLALLLGVLCARYRDLSQIVSSLLQVLYFLTPIIWMPSSLPSRAGKYLLDWNPVNHLLSIMRSPLMNELPSQSDWFTSLAICLVGWLVTLIVYGRYRRRIAFWV
jgi:lipopolysaccharide transport system permease protein